MVSGADDPFADIRPYNDSEVAEVLARLAREPELADVLAKLRLATLYRIAPPLARFFVRLWLKHTASRIDTIYDLQLMIKPHLEAQIAASALFSSSGLEGLDTRDSWLFISNHRDITMDPAFTNYAIHQAGHRTLSIAIGDNLLKRNWIADLMRLNKSFIVKRNISAPRELLATSRQLATFIRSTIEENRGPVWIAQREGRAKDGRDATEPAVIKMLSLSRDKQIESVGQTLASLKIVPVAIAYELDPCDALKAAEKAAGPGYTKADDEDIRSIGVGITGQKGHVHLSFGTPIVSSDGDDLEVDQVVAQIDRQIHQNYRLFETNLWAWQRLEEQEPPSTVTIHPGSLSKEAFYARIDALPEEHRIHALAMYANPLRKALEAVESGA